jgi:Tfp pilus assembly protein PilF
LTGVQVEQARTSCGHRLSPPLSHHLIHGDPRDAVSEAEPVLSGEGHTQCLLHSVAALAHQRLGHHDEARAAARSALDAAPTEERKQSLSQELQDILSPG